MFSPSFFTSVINSYLPEPHASLLNGILFGIDINKTNTLYQQLKTVGLLHIAVLSGINITMLSAIVTSATLFLGRRMATLITILTIVFFVIFVGPEAPIIRAGFMGILTLVAILYGRKNTIIYSLLLSIIFIAIFWPRWLTSISLQLSYGATLGLILFASKKISNLKSKKGSLTDLTIKIKDELHLSLCAQIFTAPLIFIYFKEISLISPLSNLLTAFIIPPLMVFGFLTAILGKINFFLGLIPSYICYGLLHYMIFVIKFLTVVPHAFIKF